MRHLKKRLFLSSIYEWGTFFVIGSEPGSAEVTNDMLIEPVFYLNFIHLSILWVRSDHLIFLGVRRAKKVWNHCRSIYGTSYFLLQKI